MDKKKYDVTIADVDMSIISDEREEFVLKLVEKLDGEIKDILTHSKRSSKMDAALLVALDYACARAKAEKRVRNLEAQIALYDANLRRMRDDNIKLKNALLTGKADEAAFVETAPVEELTIEDDEAEETAQISIAEEADEPAIEEKEPEAPAPSLSREDKLRQITELLRRKDD